MTEPQFTPEQLEAARAQMVAEGSPVPAAGPPDASGGSAYEADIAGLRALIEAQQQRLDALEAERRQQNMPPLVSTVAALRDLLTAHQNVSHESVPGVPAELFRLADDAVEAADGAVKSGDVTYVREIAGKILKGLLKIHPGGGDHVFHRQAVDFARDHIPEACDQVTAPAPSTAPALGSDRSPVPVVQGSRVG